MVREIETIAVMKPAAADHAGTAPQVLPCLNPSAHAPSHPGLPRCRDTPRQPRQPKNAPGLAEAHLSGHAGKAADRSGTGVEPSTAGAPRHHDEVALTMFLRYRTNSPEFDFPLFVGLPAVRYVLASTRGVAATCSPAPSGTSGRPASQKTILLIGALTERWVEMYRQGDPKSPPRTATGL